MAAIEIENLSYCYTRAEPVLVGIDPQLADGEAHAADLLRFDDHAPGMATHGGH